MTIFGDPTSYAPVFNRYAVLLGGLATSIPNAPAAFILNEPAESFSVGTTDTDATVTGVSFSANDVGKTITGTGIPALATIISVVPGVSCEISANATATGTVTASLGAQTGDWDVVGALHEDNPFSNGEESIDETKHTAAGFGVYAKTFKNQEETIEFTALETTLVTLGILYDASGVTDTAGVLEGTLAQRDPTETFRIAFQRENATAIERRVSSNHAQINSITRAQNSDRAEYTVSVTIYPNADGDLYEYYLGPDA